MIYDIVIYDIWYVIYDIWYICLLTTVITWSGCKPWDWWQSPSRGSFEGRLPAPPGLESDNILEMRSDPEYANIIFLQFDSWLWLPETRRSSQACNSREPHTHSVRGTLWSRWQCLAFKIIDSFTNLLYSIPPTLPQPLSLKVLSKLWDILRLEARRRRETML